MLFELAYPGLCLAEGVAMLAGRRRLAGRPFTYRAARCQMQRREIELLVKLSPAIAARVALHRFEAARPVPPPKQGSRVVADRPNGVDGILVERCFGLKDGPRILLLHGWNAASTMMRPLAEALAAKGARVIVPDLPGEGANPAAVLSFADKGKAIAEAYSGFSFNAVIVHSAGGLIAAEAIENGLQTTHLATVCSPLSMATLLHAYLLRTAAPTPVFDAILAHYEQREGRNPHTVGAALFAAFAGRMTVVHAQSDWQVKVSEAHAIADLCRTTPHLLEQCNHSTILNDPRLHDYLATRFLFNPMTQVVAC